MSTENKPTNQPSNGNDVESLTITLQQIAASAKTNTEQFESQKKQFFEQFSQLFGSLNTLKQQQKLTTTTNEPHNTNTNTPNSTTPLITSATSDSNNSNGNNNSNTIHTNTNIINNPTAFLSKIATNTLNLTPITPHQNVSNVVLPFQSVPMSILSNTSQSNTAYQYPYITNCKSPNIVNNISFTPSIKSQSVAITPITKPNLMSCYSNTSSQVNTPNNMNTSTPNNNVTAYESYWMRRILSNILLLLFRYHPNGVLECELCQFYEQMFSQQLVLTMDLKYLLCVHKSILITNTKERGQLYTLADDQISLFLQEFDSIILQQWIIKHIRRLFRCFPNGIACNCLQDLLYNMVEFKLSDIIPNNNKWHQFICNNIPQMYCVSLTNGCNIFITIDLNEINKIYNKIINNCNGNNNNVINASNIQYYLSNYLNFKNILKRPVGYCELLIVLLSNYYTLDINNMYYKGIDGETLEKAFHQQYQSRLVHEAPFIQDVLRKICDITIIKNQNGTETKLYKLLKSSKQYFDTQPDAFAPILNRSLELIINNNISVNNNTENEVPQSPFKEDHVSVFMGGFSHGTTIEDLRRELAKKGVTMISSSGISYRNYGWSFVTLSNDKEAQYLISISPIQIMGRNIDVRPFINRQRIRNHIGNKPSNKIMLESMIDLISLQEQVQGLTVADIQSKLFRKFSYRIDGPQLTKIVGDNPKYLYIKREKTEKIYLTPKLSINMSMDELKSKINKLWKHIHVNYRGNIYNIKEENNDDDAKDINSQQEVDDKEENNSNDDNKEADEADKAPAKSVLSNTSTKSSKSSGKRTRRGGKNRNKNKNKTTDSINITSPIRILEEESEYIISENDFENEFARRYRYAINPIHFGYNTVKELLDSLSMPFKVIIYEVDEEDENENNNNNNSNNKFNKNNLNINITSTNNTNSNITSPVYINSPSNYSNYSNHSYSNRVPLIRNNNSTNSQTSNDNYTNYTQYNNNTNTISPPVSNTTVLNTPLNTIQQTNTNYSPQQLLQYQQYAMQPCTNISKVTMPYVIGGNSVSNYSIIPSVPNSIITSNSLNSQPNGNLNMNNISNNPNINLNTINMNINMTNHNIKNPYQLNMSNMTTTNNNNANNINVNNNNNNNSTTK